MSAKLAVAGAAVVNFLCVYGLVRLLHGPHALGLWLGGLTGAALIVILAALGLTCQVQRPMRRIHGEREPTDA